MQIEPALPQIDESFKISFIIPYFNEPTTILKECIENILKLRLARSEEHTSELQSRQYLVCRLLLEKKNNYIQNFFHYHFATSIDLVLVSLFLNAFSFFFTLALVAFNALYLYFSHSASLCCAASSVL